MGNTKEMLQTLEEFKGHIQVYFKRQKDVVSKVLEDYNFAEDTYYRGVMFPNVLLPLFQKDVLSLLNFTGLSLSNAASAIDFSENYTSKDFIERLCTFHAVDQDAVQYFTDAEAEKSTWENVMVIHGKRKESSRERIVINYINLEWLDLVIVGEVNEYLARYALELREALDAFVPEYLEILSTQTTVAEEQRCKEDKEIKKLKELAERYPQVVNSLAFEV